MDMLTYAAALAAAVPIGAFISLPETAPLVVTMGEKTFLRSGVTALASAYPKVPAHLQVMCPVAPVGVTAPTNLVSLTGSPSLGLFAATDGTSAYTSSTGETGSWTLRAAINNTYSMYWTGTRFIAAGTGGTYFYSTDGLTWPSLSIPGLSLVGAPNFLQIGSKILMVDDSNTKYGYSSDSGATWAVGTFPNALTATKAQVHATSTHFVFIVASSSPYCSATSDMTNWAITSSFSSLNTPNVFSDGSYVYLINSSTIKGNLSTLPAGLCRSVTGAVWESVAHSNATGALIPQAGPMYKVGSIYVARNFSTSNIIFTTDAVNQRFLPGFQSVDTPLSMDRQQFGSNGTSILGLVLNASTNIVKAGVPEMHVDNFIAASSGTGSKFYMRVA